MTHRSLRFLALACVALLPAVAQAQRGGGTRSEATSGAPKRGDGGPSMRAPSTRDLEELNAVWLMLDKKKKLSLSDSQVAQFKALDAKIHERDKQMMTEFDSIRRDFHPPSGSIARKAPNSEPQVGGATDREMEKAQQQMRVMNYIIGQIAERRKQDVTDVLAVFTDAAQKKKAEEFLKEQDDDLAKLLPRGGGPPPGGAL